jgi:hypothetical protein
MLESTKNINAHGIVSNSFSVLSVSFDSLAPAQLTLRANLRLLYLKGSPAFSIVVNSAEFGINAGTLRADRHPASRSGRLFWPASPL